MGTCISIGKVNMELIQGQAPTITIRVKKDGRIVCKQGHMTWIPQQEDYVRFFETRTKLAWIQATRRDWPKSRTVPTLSILARIWDAMSDAAADGLFAMKKPEVEFGLFEMPATRSVRGSYDSMFDTALDA